MSSRRFVTWAHKSNRNVEYRAVVCDEGVAVSLVTFKRLRTSGVRVIDRSAHVGVMPAREEAAFREAFLADPDPSSLVQ